MKIAVVKEVRAGERRVACTPETVARLIEKQGFEVVVESGAGELAAFSDADYQKAGASILPDARSAWAAGDVVLKLNPPAALASVRAHPPSPEIGGLHGTSGSHRCADVRARARAREMLPVRSLC